MIDRSRFLKRIDKTLHAICSRRAFGALLHHGVLVGAEHRHVLERGLDTVVDIGANKGQFALAARRWAPHSRVIAFEPLDGPSAIFRKVFEGDGKVVLHQAAIGPVSAQLTMHVSSREDSSSLLPISVEQTAMFPGTGEAATATVTVATLDAFLNFGDIVAPALLKLDVQGYEYEALKGCESLLHAFDWVYCECSYVEFYAGQKLADEVATWLEAQGFELEGKFNLVRDPQGRTVQADFLFKRVKQTL